MGESNVIRLAVLRAHARQWVSDASFVLFRILSAHVDTLTSNMKALWEDVIALSDKYELHAWVCTIGVCFWTHTCLGSNVARVFGLPGSDWHHTTRAHAKSTRCGDFYASESRDKDVECFWNRSTFVFTPLLCKGHLVGHKVTSRGVIKRLGGVCSSSTSAFRVAVGKCCVAKRTYWWERVDVSL